MNHDKSNNGGNNGSKWGRDDGVELAGGMKGEKGCKN